MISQGLDDKVLVRILGSLGAENCSVFTGRSGAHLSSVSQEEM